MIKARIDLEKIAENGIAQPHLEILSKMIVEYGYILGSNWDGHFYVGSDDTLDGTGFYLFKEEWEEIREDLVIMSYEEML